MTQTARTVIVVGCGNAGLCAALSAAENGARVIVLERAPESGRGGNSTFTHGAMRFPYDADDVVRIVEDDPHLAETYDFGRYTREEFIADLARTTEYRCDGDLVDVIADDALSTIDWMHQNGVRFLPAPGRQAFKVDGRFHFWGGLVLETAGGGPGLVEALCAAAERRGVEIRYQHRAIGLLTDGRRVCGVRVRCPSGTIELAADAVVLASGGFEANAEMRTRYLGPGWDLAKVRGSRYNTGDGLTMGLAAGALPAGQWSGCHAVAWDLHAPDVGSPEVGGVYQRESYQFGVVVNAEGRRFLDEGADFTNFTYAAYGRRVLEQPGQVAWQIFDSKALGLLRSEYHVPRASKIVADSLPALAGRIDGMDTDALLSTLEEYNNSIGDEAGFDPNRLDGLSGSSGGVAKSHWARRIDTPPYHAYPITCGVTFTFGGLGVNRSAQVLDDEGTPLPGLFACGELVGGLFYFNYPGGTGLTTGAVLGRRAGAAAAGLKDFSARRVEVPV